MCPFRILRRIYGSEPTGAQFFIIENYHEFGIYHELNLFYAVTQDQDEEETESYLYALKCEELPASWDFQALTELREQGHSAYQPGKVIKMKVA